VNTTVGLSIIVKLNQLTAGPNLNVSVSFGDGTAAQSYSLMSSSVNITKNYSTAGTYTIEATPTSDLPNVAITVNTMTVNVAPPPPSYQGMQQCLQKYYI
jgi:hypothetical protein